MNGNVSPHLTATDTALSSQRWTIDWDDVTSVSIGQMPYVGGRSLRIEIFRREDLRLLRPSKTMSALVYGSAPSSTNPRFNSPRRSSTARWRASSKTFR
jgi:hypothetical protein